MPQRRVVTQRARPPGIKNARSPVHHGNLDGLPVMTVSSRTTHA